MGRPGGERVGLRKEADRKYHLAANRERERRWTGGPRAFVQATIGLWSDAVGSA